MKNQRSHSFYLTSAILTAAFLGGGDAMAATPSEARVTRIIREVKLLPSKSAARPAVIDDKVKEGTSVRTGDESRSELTFVDLTITRLGANSMFAFNRAGHSVELGGGSLLLHVPKDSGGGRISASAVTVGITGTTLILESTRAGRSRLIMLEGAARLSLKKYPSENVVVRGGQIEDVPSGATKLPPPVNIDVNDVMNKHPLIKDFAPLPSRDAIYANRPSQPSSGGRGVSVNVPVVGTLVGPAPFRPNIPRRQQPNPSGTNPSGTAGTNDGVVTNDGTASGSQTGSASQGSKSTNVDGTGTQVLSRGAQTRARPSATPPRRKKTRGR
jgi:hypothetical protein